MLIVFIGTYNPVGILGGMGPEATADLYLRIVRILQARGAKYDFEFPQIIINSLPIPDLVESQKYQKEISKLLIDGVKQLENSGVTFIAVACNSVYSYFDEMQRAVSIPIINIMDETVKFARKQKYTKIGLLATKTTIKNRLFEESFNKCNINIINPTRNQQKTITKIILNILKGKKSVKDTLTLKSIIISLQNKGAEAVILGCTELPLILSTIDCDTNLIDTTEIIARKVIEKAKAN